MVHGEARADGRNEEVAHVADEKDEDHRERVAREVAVLFRARAVVEEDEGPENDGMEVVQRIEDRQDVRKERGREPLERHRRVGSQEPSIEGDEPGVFVDGVYGPDEGPEPVEDHDDASDDVVIKKDLKILGRVRIAPPYERGDSWNKGDHPHSQKNSGGLQLPQVKEAGNDEACREERRQGVDGLPAHGAF